MNKITTKNRKTNAHVVLAFSGGLDTSFCVPYLIDKGYRVTTVFVDSGGVSYDEKSQIKERALSLGAINHIEKNIEEELWQAVIIPLIWSGYWYQNQYPLLCSDRYLIVAACLKVCDQLGSDLFAHGCTGMGNDQVRFDLAVQCLGDYKILSPIREIQKLSHEVREYEKNYLINKGFKVSDQVSSYSVNENLLGVTISGTEIDQWKQPLDKSFLITPSKMNLFQKETFVNFEFNKGCLVALDNKKLDATFNGTSVMKKLNRLVGSYSIGRGVYTGDTSIGLKGRIAFEAPALIALQTAHRALEECILSKAQNRFKLLVAQKWTELVYEGFFYDPLKYDLEAFLESSQKQVSGQVILQLKPGHLTSVEVVSDNILLDSNSVYAQSASWNIEESVGFIKLFGQSSVMASRRNKK